MIKQQLAANRLGQGLISMAEHIDLYRDALGTSEKLGLKVNGILTHRLRNRLCADGKIFIDIGVHIGSVIGGVRLHSRPSRIIGIEAIPEKVAALRQRFPDVEFHQCALGDHEGAVEFTVDTRQSGYSSLDPGLRERKGQYRFISVTMTTLDAIVPHDDVDFIKIDVEGAELGVLRGGEKVAAKSRPIILFESGPNEMAGYPKETLFGWFAKNGYGLFMPDRLAHKAPGASLPVFLDAHEYPRRTLDWFAVPDERRDEVRKRAREILV